MQENAIFEFLRLISTQIYDFHAVADPGFPVGGGADLLGGSQPPMHMLFSENVCVNERIGSCWGGAAGAPLDPPMMGYLLLKHLNVNMNTTIVCTYY